MRRSALSVIVLLVSLGIAAPACSAPEATSSERAHAIEAQVWSPYCPGRLLIDCTTSQARDLRAEIRDRVDRGEASDEVIAWVRGEFGDEAVARPRTSGFGLVVWLVPALLFVVGLVVVVVVMRRARVATRGV